MINIIAIDRANNHTLIMVIWVTGASIKRWLVMKHTLKCILLFCVTTLMVGCKLAVIVVEGGEVQSRGSGVCVAGAICIIDVDDPYFYETFMAVPSTDWYFHKWNSGDKFFCGGSSDQNCTLSFQGHEARKAVEKMVASSEILYLMPLFKPYKDVIMADGKEWLQATLFKDLTWEEINSICPAGKCKDNGNLNGNDMTGWKWATVDDVNALFNVYIENSILGPNVRFFQDITGQQVGQFFRAGWRPTYDGPWREWLFTEWRVLLSDQEPYDGKRGSVGEGFAFQSHDLDGVFNAASFSVEIGFVEEAEATYGAAFYR
ncbi:MAG: hypothetical protein V7742_22305 [Halioglobus sp.]